MLAVIYELLDPWQHLPTAEGNPLLELGLLHREDDLTRLGMFLTRDIKVVVEYPLSSCGFPLMDFQCVTLSGFGPRSGCKEASTWIDPETGLLRTCRAAFEGPLWCILQAIQATLVDPPRAIMLPEDDVALPGEDERAVDAAKVSDILARRIIDLGAPPNPILLQRLDVCSRESPTDEIPTNPSSLWFVSTDTPSKDSWGCALLSRREKAKALELLWLGGILYFRKYSEAILNIERQQTLSVGRDGLWGRYWSSREDLPGWIFEVSP